MIGPIEWWVPFSAGMVATSLLGVMIHLGRIARATNSIARSLVRIAYSPPPAKPHAAEAPAAHPKVQAVAGGRE